MRRNGFRLLAGGREPALTADSPARGRAARRERADRERADLRGLTKFLLAITALLLLSVPSLEAAIVTGSFSGTIDSVHADLASRFTVGDSLTGTYTFESTTPPRGGSDGNFAFFDALLSMDFDLDGYLGAGSSPLEIQIDNNPGGGFFDRYGISTGVSGGEVNGLQLEGFSLRADDTTDSVFSTALALPTSLSLASFSSGQFFLFFTDGVSADPFLISGVLDTLDVGVVAAVVPEPATCWLATLGLFGLTQLRTRSRKPTA